MNEMLNELHEEVAAIYRWFAKEAGPGVRVREEGHLARLWALIDQLEAQGEH